MELNTDNISEMWSTTASTDSLVHLEKHHDYYRIEVYCVIGILAFFSIVGTTGNALVMYVFYQKRDKSVATLFILALAFVDFLTCLVVVPYTMVFEYYESRVVYDGVCKLYQFLITSNIPFSAFIMVAIAIDRYLCICHPFLHAMNPLRAKFTIAGLAIFAFTLGVITSLIFGVYRNIEKTVPIFVRSNISHETTYLGSFYNTRQEEFAFGTMLKNISRVLLDDNVTEMMIYQPNSNVTYVVRNKTLTLINFDGNCWPNDLILSERFQKVYQKIYSSMFVISLIIVMVLYVMIYRSVLARRKKRQKQKSKQSLPTTKTATVQVEQLEPIDDNTTLMSCQTQATSFSNKNEATTPLNSPISENGAGNGTEELLPNAAETKPEKKADKKKNNSKKVLKKDHRIANLKTAAMLFVVTIVFIVTYLPSFLMALRLIPYQQIVFYMYFANNVANPVIYSFMNRNFRDDLKAIFTQCKRKRRR